MNKNNIDLKHHKLLGNQIKKLRKERDLTIEELSQRTQIRLEYLRKIEAGKAVGVRLVKHIFKIAEELNVTLYKLFDYN